MLIPLLLSVLAATWPQPSIDGVASWYGDPRSYGKPAVAWYTRQSQWGAPVEFYAAAGPKLRRMIGDPNPYHEHYPLFVTNRKTGVTIRVVVVDWCGCSKDRPGEKLIDLAPSAFRAVCGPLGRGICGVTVSPIAPVPGRVVDSADSAHGGAGVRGWTDGSTHHRARHRVGAALLGGYWYA